MKKYLLTSLIIISLHLTGYSQDKIVTLKNDTIECKITRISSRVIYFDIITEDVRSSGKLPCKSVSNYIVSDNSISGRQRVGGAYSFKRLHLSLYGGTGYLTGSTEKAEEDLASLGFKNNQVKSYYKDLRSGMIAKADLAFMISPKFGAGFKYKLFDTSCSMEGFYDPQDGINLFYTTFKEHTYVNFLGPSFNYQQSLGKDKKFRLNCTSSTGLAFYRNEAEFLKEFLLMTGKSLGVDASAGFEYFISPYFSVGADLSAFSSTIKKMNVSNGSETSEIKLEKGEYENISRLDLLLGIRLYLWDR